MFHQWPLATHPSKILLLLGNKSNPLKNSSKWWKTFSEILQLAGKLWLKMEIILRMLENYSPKKTSKIPLLVDYYKEKTLFRTSSMENKLSKIKILLTPEPVSEVWFTNLLTPLILSPQMLKNPQDSYH